MEVSVIVALILGAINIFGGFVLFPMRKDIDSLETVVKWLSKELGEYKLHVAENYVTKSELTQHLDRIEKSLDEIKTYLKGQ